MNARSDNVIRFIPRPLEIITLEQLVRHGRYATPRYLSFWLAGEEERSEDGEGHDIHWSVKPLPGNLWEVVKATRTFRPGDAPEESTETSGPLDLDGLRSYLADRDFPISDALFEVLKSRSE